jgi:hypothetical protein
VDVHVVGGGGGGGGSGEVLKTIPLRVYFPNRETTTTSSVKNMMGLRSELLVRCVCGRVRISTEK